MAKRPYRPSYAAGVLALDSDWGVLAVSRQKPRKHKKVAHYMYDWGLPGGLSAVGEYPVNTAARELYEETGLTAPSGLLPLLVVPPELTSRGIPFHVFIPDGPLVGNMLRNTAEGAVAWVRPSTLTEVYDPGMSVAESNRYILYWALGALW